MSLAMMTKKRNSKSWEVKSLKKHFQELESVIEISLTGLWFTAVKGWVVCVNPALLRVPPNSPL